MVVERNQSPIRTLITSTAPAWANGPRLGKRFCAVNHSCLGASLSLVYCTAGLVLDMILQTRENDGRMWTVNAPETLCNPSSNATEYNG